MKNWLRKHYHWIIAVTALLQYTVTGGIANNLTSLFVLDVTADLGITRSAFSLAFMMKSLTTFLASLVIGLLLRRFGYRKLAVVGLVALGIGYVLLGGVGGIVTLALCCACMGAFSAFTGTACVSRLVSNWFHRHKGTVLGLVTAATGLGGAIFSVVLTGVNQGSGWRWGYRLCGVLLLILAVLVVLIVRNRPEDMGLLPLGEEHEGRKEHRKRLIHRADAWGGLPMEKLKRQPTFYLALLATVLSCLCSYAGTSFLVPHLRDQGMSPERAAGMQSLMMLLLAASKILYGTVCDRIGPKKVMVFAMLCCTASAGLLSVAQNTGTALATVLFMSLAAPVVTVQVPLLTTELFGNQAGDLSVSLMLAMVSFSGMLTSPIMNAIHDLAGSYIPGLRAASILALLTLGLYLLLFFLAARDRKKWEAQKITS